MPRTKRCRSEHRHRGELHERMRSRSGKEDKKPRTPKQPVAAQEPCTPRKAKTWLASEDLVLLRCVLDAGERALNWNAALAQVNEHIDGSNERTMASVRGHWTQQLRPRLELTLDPQAGDVKYGTPRAKRVKKGGAEQAAPSIAESQSSHGADSC